MNLILFATFILFLPTPSHSAPCCAGSSSVPALITGDEAQLFSFGLGYATVIADAPGAGQGWPTFRDQQSNQEKRISYTFNYARLIDDDRLQAGISVPMLSHYLKTPSRSESSTQLGDLSFTLGYETLPEYEYSEWIPRIYNFLQIVTPTGKNLYESDRIFNTDAGGLGFWQLHLGAIVLKKWNDWDASIVIKYGRYLGRNFDSPSQGNIDVDSTGAWTGSIAAGYMIDALWRVGLSLEPQFLYPQSIRDDGVASQTSERLLWNVGASITHLIGADSSVILSYADQTLMGPVSNTTLSRIWGLAYQYRIER